MHWRQLFNQSGVGDWGTQGKAKRRSNCNMHHLFGLLPMLKFPNYFSFPDIDKQGADDPSEKEYIET